MTCNEVMELIGQYWDLADNDLHRKKLQEHIKHCPSCAEEFELWKQSSELIQDASSQFVYSKPHSSTSNLVMQRIYADEGWREPIPARIYSISYALRRRLTVAISFFLALFMLGFIYSFVSDVEADPMYYTFDGIMPVASAVGNANVKDNVFGATLQGVPVASISDPFILSVNSIKTYPDYVIVLSLLGIVCTLLIMNWFSRIRA